MSVGLDVEDADGLLLVDVPVVEVPVVVVLLVEVVPVVVLSVVVPLVVVSLVLVPVVVVPLVHAVPVELRLRDIIRENARACGSGSDLSSPSRGGWVTVGSVSPTSSRGAMPRWASMPESDGSGVEAPGASATHGRRAGV